MKKDNPNGTKTQAQDATAKPKVDLSASQRKGAEERALEASANAAKVSAATKDEHQHADLIRAAAKQAERYADDAMVAGSVADAQYASRKAIEAAAAAGWLYGQRA